MAESYFEIGLSMAGAVSAGAYQAGVVDFLFQALDAWQAEKDRGAADVPAHDVKLKVVSGSSAGGMTAALLAVVAHRDFPRVADAEGARRSLNNLFEAWVNRIDMEDLLGSQDRGEPALPSLLDSTVLDSIAQDVFRSELKLKKRAFVDSAFRTIICFTNQRGVPYRIPFKGETQQGHDMAQHSDRLEFSFERDSPVNEGQYWIDPCDCSGENWSLMRQAALASGAFPIGLAPRMIERRRQDYEKRQWLVPTAGPSSGGGPPECGELRPITPSWNSSETGEKVCFWAVDAGVTNNEPFELAREYLAGGRGKRNDRSATSVGQIVIMVDPFVGRSDAPEDRCGSARPLLVRQLMSILSSAIGEARFKPADLALAQDEGVCSRFLIAPVRWSDGKRLLSPKAIACGSLGAFGGFLSRGFRVHDFLLGRRNCQQFLRKHFALEVDAGEINARFQVPYKEAKAKGWLLSEGTREFMPIIPLVGEAKDDVPSPRWPVFKMDDLDRLGAQMEKRMDFLVHRARASLPWTWLTRPLAWSIWGLAAPKVRELLLQEVRDRLDQHELLLKVR